MSAVRVRLAVAATVAVGRASRWLGRGSGSVVGGRAGLAIAPDLVRSLAADRMVALVSATNGKTTTTRLLVTALGGTDRVATSAAGANLPAGIAAALAGADPGSPAVLEVDEGYLASVADAVRPTVVALLNLSRDQLDRVSEVRAIATRWRAALSRLQGTTVVANADDPLVAWAASSAPSVRWVAAGQLWRADATGCPSCGGRIQFGGDEGDVGWACPACGLRRPEPMAVLRGTTLGLADGRRLPVATRLPGRCNVANAAMAAVAAEVMGVDAAEALASMAAVAEVEGRFAVARHRCGADGHEVAARLLLAKNPAGWVELLDLLDGGRSEPRPVVVGINARIADGRDPSWLWDVAFERLEGRLVVATGERAWDLAVRLRSAGVDHRVEPDQVAALHVPGVAEVDYAGNYTAFQELRRRLDRGRGRRDRSGEQPRVVAGAPAAGSGGRARPSGSELRVVVVHPELLGTYGDGGNATVLAARAAWRGHDVDVVLAGADDPLPASGDVYLLGGGEDGPQVQAAAVLAQTSLRRAVDGGAVLLAVCAGFQVVGTSFPGPDGLLRDGLGLLDVATVKRNGPRAVGELLAEPVAAEEGAGEPVARGLVASGGLLTGFENHSGATTLGPAVRPLGHVTRGVGNDGGGGEGAWSGRVVGTYLHGPVLARNPALADALLAMALGAAPEPIDDAEEAELRRERIGAATAADRGRLGRFRVHRRH